MTLFRLAITEENSGLDGSLASKNVQKNSFSALCKALEMLEVDFAIEVQARLQLGNDLRRSGKGVVDVMTGFEMAGIVGELAPTELGDLIDLPSFGFDFLGDGADEFIDSPFE
jgi:hypothetical protein